MDTAGFASGGVLCYALRMKVELTPDAASWVQAELDAGRFPTAEDAIRFAVNEAKRRNLSAMLEASRAEGGDFSANDVRLYVSDQLDRRALKPSLR